MKAISYYSQSMLFDHFWNVSYCCDLQWLTDECMSACRLAMHSFSPAVEEEALLELMNGECAVMSVEEARHVRMAADGGDEHTKLFVMRSEFQETANEQEFEVMKHVGADAARTEDVQVFLRQFERTRLEVPVSSGTVGEHKAEVDMQNVSVAVDENIAVVTVLHSEQVAEETVAGVRLHVVRQRLCVRQ